MARQQPSEDKLAILSRRILQAQIPTKLFHFTKEEEKRMHNAKLAAIRFMARFGQAPQQPLIDLSHYENSDASKNERKRQY